MTLVYGIVRREPVIIMGQALSIFIYVRNLMLIFKEERERRAKASVVSLNAPLISGGSKIEPTLNAAFRRSRRSRANPASRSAFRSSRSSRPTWKRRAGPPGFHAVAVR